VREHLGERPVRVVYVGRVIEDRKWTLTARAGGIVPNFVDHRTDDLVERLSALRPDVVVVFEPQRLPRGVAGGLPAVTVAYVLQPLELAYTKAENGDPWRVADALDPGAVEQWLDVVGAFDSGEYDRILAADPRVARLSGGLDVWRSPPLPVDDALYRPTDQPLLGAKALFIGESTDYREWFLVEAKHHYDLRHYAFGLAGDRLAQILAETSVGVVLPPGPFSTFEPAAPLHLAAGHVLLAAPLAPPRGLESGLDHLTIHGHGDLLHYLYEITTQPAAFEVLRQRGRVRAEEFRASRIWPRLIRDLFLDLQAVGSWRREQVARPA
jgi:hypothetical protein